MKLVELISGLDVRCVTQGAAIEDIRICDLTEDSRTAVPGSLFIARAGTQTQGSRYIKPAVDCGCVAVLADDPSTPMPERCQAVLLVTDDVALVGAQLAERFYGHPASSLITAGITGTNGKTTVVHLAHQLIESAGVRCGLIGTVEVDDGRERAPASMTTPPAVEMSRTLATMVEHGCQAVVMEVSSHALDQSRVGAIEFDVAGFTNLTGDHLDYHQTIEHYQNAKAKLFSQLKADGLAVINADDKAHAQMVQACGGQARVVTCTMQESVEIISEAIEGMRLNLTTPMGQIEAVVPLFGAYNAMNVLQAVLVAQEVLVRAGLKAQEIIDEIRKELEHLVLPTGRLEHAESAEDDIVVLVDFAHTDDALKSTLGAICRVKPKNSLLWCVFGCGGDRDTTKRPRMGKAASDLADRVVITSDNPRTEVPGQIINQVLEGIEPLNRMGVVCKPDRAQAIGYAIEQAFSGDVILIAGKGHEKMQISPDGAGGTYSSRFDDREHAQIALRQRRLIRDSQAEQA